VFDGERAHGVCLRTYCDVNPHQTPITRFLNLLGIPSSATRAAFSLI
jgi:hypothetical protein